MLTGLRAGRAERGSVYYSEGGQPRLIKDLEGLGVIRILSSNTCSYALFITGAGLLKSKPLGSPWPRAPRRPRRRVRLGEPELGQEG